MQISERTRLVLMHKSDTDLFWDHREKAFVKDINMDCEYDEHRLSEVYNMIQGNLWLAERVRIVRVTDTTHRSIRTLGAKE